MSTSEPPTQILRDDVEHALLIDPLTGRHCEARVLAETPAVMRVSLDLGPAPDDEQPTDASADPTTDPGEPVTDGLESADEASDTTGQAQHRSAEPPFEPRHGDPVFVARPGRGWTLGAVDGIRDRDFVLRIVQPLPRNR